VKAGFALILTMALGALVAHYVLQENGYVLINFQGYSVQMSVPIMAFVLLLAYLAVRIVVRLWRAPRRLGQYAADRRSRKAGERITQGYIELGQGNFARSEKLLTRGARHSETPLLNYLAAARAAQAQGNKQRRDNWLSMAQEQEPGASTAVLLAQAELQLENQERDAATHSLQKILEETPKNTVAMRMLASIFLEDKNWEALEELLPQLRRFAKTQPEQLDDWTVMAWSELLKIRPVDPKNSKVLIKKLPRHLRENAQILKAQAEGYIASERVDEAEVLVRKALDRHWDNDLVRLYGVIKSPAKAKLLKRAEAWLAQRPEDPTLLLAAGRLCVQNKLWGKARSYFETSLGIEPSPETWHELGQLLTQMGEAESASDAYQKGLTLSYSGPAVPRLEADLGQPPD
jgi:HemY protein